MTKMKIIVYTWLPSENIEFLPGTEQKSKHCIISLLLNEIDLTIISIIIAWYIYIYSC